ncbi:AGAP004738-PA-like protein [Anopheles sinensis]|uniref:AGAP004738-PA-like protein n=1 Tax=Anopheles sinensis TaxID=74873 RepID=A0A084VZT7_ANOSI|nr:AGAP004738-PA-like protein [Anopheles sinensis]
MPIDNDTNEPETPATQRLTNDDFRKLLMTPRAPPGGAHAAGTVRDAMSKATPGATSTGPSSSSLLSSSSSSSSMKPPSSERHEARRKKKNFYAQLKKQEDNKLAELAEKYRDRARERRDGANPDYQNLDSSSSTSAYRAVAPDAKSGMDAAERRRQQIQESKFLGGDMEHTHLVKGLDYALLQKVRSEIIAKELEQEDEMEKLVEMEPSQLATATVSVQKSANTAEKDQPNTGELEFRTVIGQNIFRILEKQRSRTIERNEMFAPGRTAYHIELEDENADSDIPTTVIRSKAEVPLEVGDTQTLTTNDIVINKLAQILSYLRQGGRGKKNKRRDKDKPLFKFPEEPGSKGLVDDSIYGEIGDYQPNRRYEDVAGSSKLEGNIGKHSYFEKYNDEHKAEECDTSGMPPVPAPPKLSAHLITKLTAEPEGYAECYPGLQEMNDAIDDSDDEVDYTKMDLGNKKGPIGRWDFDTQEEYSDYMSSKEALPKAAFQYGVKMQDGRKTRKHKTEKNEKAELDREWQQIQNIIQKRKTKSGIDDEVDLKKQKY